jgi:hypothetical protein
MKLKAIRLIPGSKVTHDIVEDASGKVTITDWSYQDLVNGNIPAIGIHAASNRLIIIDVDVPSDGRDGGHKYDGTPWWRDFASKNFIPLTYSVRSASGGYHFYFKLPPHIDEVTFQPPKTLALGVDVKFNGYVGAPPTPGYEILYPQLAPGQPLEEAHKAIVTLPQCLYEEMIKVKEKGGQQTYVEGGQTLPVIRRGYSEAQIAELRYKLHWCQQNAELIRDEWVHGIFSIRAGVIDNDELLNELITMWTCNRSFREGDMELAWQYAKASDPHGKIGPGTIFAIIDEIFKRHGHVTVGAVENTQSILEKAGIMPEFDKKGKIKISPSESNGAAILGAMFPENEMYYDLRQDLYVFKGQPKSDIDIVNTVIPTIQNPLSGFGLEKLTKRVLLDGLDVIMCQRQVDPHREFLNTVKWDGVERIATCLIDYLGCEDNEYNRILGTNLFTALAARGLSPGIKFDSVFVFEGFEGLKKSSFVEFLGGAYTYTPSQKDCFQNLDCLRQMHQSIVVELPELIGLLHVDSETAKGFTAKPFDHIRGLFARKAMKRNRGFIIMGTTNSTHYLQKDMGARRWWPIRVPRRPNGIDMTGLYAVRDQLFAEGVQKFRNGHLYYYMPDELLLPIIRERQQDQSFKFYVAELVGATEGFTTLSLFNDLVKNGLLGRRLTPQIQTQIEDALTELGFKQRKDKFKTVWIQAEEKKTEEWLHLKDLV